MQGLNNVNGRIPGREMLPSGAPKRFLTFSIFLFFLTCLIYFGMSVGYKAYLNREINNLDASISDLRDKVPPEQQNELVRFFSQVGNIKGILDDHIVASNLFGMLEKYTGTKVAYKSMQVSTTENKIVLNGVAATYDSLVSQLSIFESIPEVKSAVLDNSQRTSGVVSFRITLTVDKSLFDLDYSKSVVPQQPVDENNNNAQ